jgi:quercetin dioxygenase-like cupin family protein
MNFRVICFLACVGSTAILAQDVLTVAPAGVAKVEYEDSQVRVLRFKEPPGTKLAMHSHPPYASVSLTDDVSQYTFPDGKTADQKSKAGEAEFSKAVTHASQNSNETISDAVLVELKTQPAGVVLTGPGDMVKANSEMCKVEVDNDYVRITRVTVPAHGTLAMHRHPSENVVVYLTGGHLKTTTSGGQAQDTNIAPGTVRVNPAGEHSNENLGDQTSEAVLIELKTAAK